jgi:hypothetical protein
VKRNLTKKRIEAVNGPIEARVWVQRADAVLLGNAIKKNYFLQKIWKE